MRRETDKKTKRTSGMFAKTIAGTAAGVMTVTMALTAIPVNVLADGVGSWQEENGIKYWYENGVKQGVKYNEDGSIDITYRGKEIYDPSSNAWYWLDNVQNGAVAKDKDVYQESEAGEWGDTVGDDGKTYGKWVRYDADGHMVKGWQTTEAGTYYFDPIYGTMAKGDAFIDGQSYHFNEATGILETKGQDDDGNSFLTDGWHKVDGVNYWYENGVRQGVKYNADGSIDTSYRGKEIYDPSTNAWYWLDNVQNGAVAKNKDVYQESEAGEWGDTVGEDGKTYGKWVRYDADGHMVKGWQTTEAGTYYFDPVYGTMAKGLLTFKPVNEDYATYYFDNVTGIMAQDKIIEVDGVRYKAYSDGTCSAIVKTAKTTYLDADGEITGILEATYDNEGKALKRTGYNDDGSIAWYEESEYDDNGNWLKHINTSQGIYVYYEYNSSGQEVKSTYYDKDGNVDAQYITEYNADGNKIKMTHTGRDGKIVNITEYLYDAQLLSQEINYSYDTDGSSYIDMVEEYDGHGNVIKETSYNKDGEIYSIYDYEYDEKGTMIKYTSSYPLSDGRIYVAIEEYDSYGNRIRNTNYGKIEMEIKYEYNSYGEIISQIVYDYYATNGDPAKDFMSYIEYNEYDVYGNKTKQTIESYSSYYNNWRKVEGSWSYEYDKNGNITAFSEYDKNGSVIWSYTAEYDIYGKKTKYTELSIDGSEHFYIYEYDEKGNEIKRTHFNMDGTVISSQISEYQY